MTAKEYLNQAFLLDQQISSKMAQLSSLQSLSMKVTTTYSDVPASGTRNVHQMEDVIVKIMEMEDEIKADLEDLVDLKADILRAIKAVDDTECRILLEMRYLCFRTWEQIAVEMDCTMDNVFKLHRKALNKVHVPAACKAS